MVVESVILYYQSLANRLSACYYLNSTLLFGLFPGLQIVHLHS